MAKQNTILVLGLGDLAKRLTAVLLMSEQIAIKHLVIVSRNKQQGNSYTRLLSGCSTKSVKFCQLDALDTKALEILIADVKPDLIVQCASLISPWLLYENQQHPKALALLNCGFAAQLPAQLPVAISLMQALKNLDLDCPVINCSYPDIVNPVLARLGMPVTLGIGNSGMVHGLLRTQLESNEQQQMQLFAHHAHISSVANCELNAGMKAPLAYVDGKPLAIDKLLFEQDQILMDRELNVLTCGHAMEVISALLLDDGPALHTSVPAPLGLEGGWPVKISSGEVQLDLPPQLSIVDIEPLQRHWSEFDGVGDIEDDGTIVFETQCRDKLAQLAPALAEPLKPRDSLQRIQVIEQLIR